MKPATRRRGILVGVLGMGAGAALLAIVVLHGPSVTTALQAAMVCSAAISIWRMQSLREVKAENFRQHGLHTALFHLAATNLAAVAYAWFMYVGYVRDSVVSPFGSAAKDYMLATALLGGTLALFRSSGGTSATYALVRQLDDLKAQIRGSADLAGMALRAQRASDVRELAEIAGRMLDAAIDSHDASDGIDALTLWLRDDAAKRWRIWAGRGVSQKTLRDFWQPIVSIETPGAGIVSNMVATRTPHVALPNDIEKHRWYASDADSARTPGSFAAVLLYDHRHEAIGALCLTSQVDGAVPSENDAEAFSSFRKVLYLWAAVFTLLAERQFELEKATRR